MLEELWTLSLKVNHLLTKLSNNISLFQTRLVIFQLQFGFVFRNWSEPDSLAVTQQIYSPPQMYIFFRGFICFDFFLKYNVKLQTLISLGFVIQPECNTWTSHFLCHNQSHFLEYVF